MTETMVQTYVKDFERKENNSVLNCIALVLCEILSETDKLDSPLTLFHASKVPTISLQYYLQRVAKYAKCSEECYVLALIYLDRIQEMNQEILLNSYCVHRFLIAAVMVAIKFHDDDYYRNDYYAKVGGITVKEINILEKEVLNLLQYKLFVDQSMFNTYLVKLQQFNEI